MDINITNEKNIIYHSEKRYVSKTIFLYVEYLVVSFIQYFKGIEYLIKLTAQ